MDKPIQNPSEMLRYDAIVTFPAGALHVQTNTVSVLGCAFLPPEFPGASRPGRTMIVDDAPPVLRQACEQLLAYFSGQRQTFDLPLLITGGTDFQRNVWEQLRQIPFGATWSYEELASRVIREGQQPRQLARAVGAACKANPLPVLIPCHRVIGKNGRLVGFGGGVEVKAYLLNHEMLGI
jgi:methylated-DNA-[protein]-cysteine S-methyltransferase